MFFYVILKSSALTHFSSSTCWADRVEPTQVQAWCSRTCRRRSSAQCDCGPTTPSHELPSSIPTAQTHAAWHTNILKDNRVQNTSYLCSQYPPTSYRVVNHISAMLHSSSKRGELRCFFSHNNSIITVSTSNMTFKYTKKQQHTGG